MQTFLPYPNALQSALALDGKRLYKQALETTQILDVLVLKNKYYCHYCGVYAATTSEFNGYLCRRPDPADKHVLNHDIKQTPWYNHPAVNMWRGYEIALYDYTQVMITIATKRGYDTASLRDKMPVYLDEIITKDYVQPWWWGIPELHQSHRANLLRKNYEFYSKQGFMGDLTTPYWWPNATTKLQWELKQKQIEEDIRKNKTILLLNEDIRNSL